MSSVVGPPLAGFITDNFSWNWVFLMNVPAGIPVLWLLARTFPQMSPRVEKRKLDYTGMATLTLAVASLMIALSSGGLHYRWDSLQVGGLLGFGLAMALIFLVIESKSDSPIMPLEIYKNRAVAVSVLVTVLTGFGLHSTALFTPLFFQGVLGSTATGSGGLLTPMMLGMVFGAIVSGRRLSRTGEGYRRQVLIASGAMAVGIYLISTMNGNTGFARAVAYVSLTGLGLGGAMSACNLAVQNSVPFRLVGSAISAIQFSRLFSGTLGLAVLGVVLTASFSSRLEETVSESARAALAQGQFEAIKQNPRVLVDPTAIDALRAGFAERGLDGVQMADTFLGIDAPELIEEMREAVESAQINQEQGGLTRMVGPDYLEREPNGVFLYNQIRGLNPPLDPDRPLSFSQEDGAVSKDELSALTMPTIFLAGAEDAIIPAELIERAAQMVSGAQYIQVPHAGHSVYWEQPEEFNRILEVLLLEAFV